jgi:hypothetical protein
MRPLLAFLFLASTTLAAQQLPTIDVLAQSPADTVTDLQVICLFHPTPGVALQGALAELDTKTHGLLSDLRPTQPGQPIRFHADLGETLLLTPPPGTLRATHLLLIGLGDPATFTPETMPARMTFVGAILLRSSVALHAAHPYFAPTIKDGGVDGFSTGDIATPVVTGFLTALATERHLETLHADFGPTPTQLTYLAGKQFKATTEAGVAKAFAASK